MSLAEGLRGGNPWFLVCAVALGFIPWLMHAARIFLWTRVLGRPLNYRRCLNIVMGAEVASAITPTVAGGGYMKMAMLMEDGFSVGTSASLMLVGSLEDAVVFIFAIPVLLTLSAAWDHPYLRELAGLAAGSGRILAAVFGILILAAVSAVLWRRTKKQGKTTRPEDAPKSGRLMRMARDIASFFRLAGGKGLRILPCNLVLSAVQWGARYHIVTAWLAYLGVRTDPILFSIFQWLIYSAGMIVLTPGGSVGLEASFYMLYQNYVPEGTIGIATAGWRILSGYLQIAVGAVSVFFSAVRKGGGRRRILADAKGMSLAEETV